MIRTSRRGALIGALAVPTLAGLASWRWKHGERAMLVHDASLAAGQRFAAASDGKARAIEGDRIRFARELLAGKPSLVAGVTRHADLLLIADVAAEAGYAQVATLHARAGRCIGNHCQPGWGSLARLGKLAGSDWAEALAGFALNPGEAAKAGSPAGGAAKDVGLVLGWVLAPKG